MTLLATARFDNLVGILADLQAKGIRYKLVEGVFRADNKVLVMTEEILTGIEECRNGLGMALARQQALCLVCKLRKAARPYTRPPGGEHKDWCERCWQQVMNTLTDKSTLTPISDPAEKQTKEDKLLCLSLI